MQMLFLHCTLLDSISELLRARRRTTKKGGRVEPVEQSQSVLPCSSFFPTLGVGLLDFRLNSSPRPELFSSPGLLLAHPWSAQPHMSLECPTLECPCCHGVPNPRVSLEPNRRVSVSLELFLVPNPRASQSAQPQSVPGANPRVSLTREAKRGWGDSKQNDSFGWGGVLPCSLGEVFSLCPVFSVCPFSC